MSLNWSWNPARSALEGAGDGWALVCEVTLLVCGFKRLLYLTNALRSRLHAVFSDACWASGSIPNPLPCGSGHGLEQIMPAWGSKALGTTFPVSVYLHRQPDWIWSHTGDMRYYS